MIIIGSDAPLRVLIVDDCPDNAYILAVLLKRLDCEVRVICDAVTALDAAAEFKPQLGLFDIAMPACDGYSLARQFRHSPDLRAVRLIAISGYADQVHRDRAMEAGFAEYLVKPYSLKELATVVNSVRREAAFSRPTD